MTDKSATRSGITLYNPSLLVKCKKMIFLSYRSNSAILLLFGLFCGCRGFCHRTESDLFLFLLRLNDRTELRHVHCMMMSLIIKCFATTNTSVQNFAVRFSCLKTALKCLRKPKALLINLLYMYHLYVFIPCDSHLSNKLLQIIVTSSQILLFAPSIVMSRCTLTRRQGKVRFQQYNHDICVGIIQTVYVYHLISNTSVITTISQNSMRSFFPKWSSWTAIDWPEQFHAVWRRQILGHADSFVSHGTSPGSWSKICITNLI